MTTKKQVTVTLTKNKDTKNKVRYGSDDPALDAAYVGNDAVKKLGNPDKITVRIEAA